MSTTEESTTTLPPPPPHDDSKLSVVNPPPQPGIDTPAPPLTAKDYGVCYFDPEVDEGTTEFFFRPCGLDYEGEVVVIEREPIATTAPTPPPPAAVALPETGSDPALLGVGALMIALGVSLRRLAIRNREEDRP